MPSFSHKSIRSFSLSSSLLLGIVVFSPLQLFGAEQASPETAKTPATTQGIPETPKADRFDVMEAPRNYLSGKITRLASDIDRFFGGDRHYQESNPTVIQLSVARTDGYAGGRKFDLAARLNLRLPVTEGRLRLLVETDPEKNIITGPTPVQGNAVLPNKVVAPKSVALALRVVAAEQDVWNFNTDAGLKFPLPIQPFVRSRGSYSAPLGKWRLKAAQSVYWFKKLGAGETTQLDLERVYSDHLLFRATTNATWLNTQRNFDLSQNFAVYHTLDDRTALLYQASAIGVSKPKVQVMDYVALVSYRYRLHQKWLFFEASPQLHFPRDKNFKISPALMMRLEMLFDDSR